MKGFNRKDKLNFGKWRGHTVEDVLKYEPGYIGWLIVADIAYFDEQTEVEGLRGLDLEDTAQLDRMALAYGFEQH